MTQGIAICIECSGVHRSLGSHISKVRSLKLDALEPETILLMTQIGNSKANTKVFEVTLPEGQRIASNVDRAAREAFIKAKYVEKRWIAPMEDLQGHLVALMRRKNPFKPVSLLAALAQPGADINWQRPGNQRTLLHKCVFTQNMGCVVLLLKLECRLDMTDSSGMTPLHTAAQINSAPMARILMQHGASMTIADKERRTARDVAIDHDAVDCIALLDEDLNDGAMDDAIQAAVSSDLLKSKASVPTVISTVTSTSAASSSTSLGMPGSSKKPPKTPRASEAIPYSSSPDDFITSTPRHNTSRTVSISAHTIEHHSSDSDPTTDEKRKNMKKSKSGKNIAATPSHGSAPASTPSHARTPSNMSSASIPAPIPDPLALPPLMHLEGGLASPGSTPPAQPSPISALSLPILNLPPPPPDSARDSTVEPAKSARLRRPEKGH